MAPAIVALITLMAGGTDAPPQQTVESRAPEEERVIPLSLMLFPTIGTDGLIRDEPHIKIVSIALIAGYAWRVRGLDLSGGLAWTEREMRGVQLASGGLVEGDLRGMQLAGSIGYGGAMVHGLQAAGLGSYAGGELHGLQWGGLGAMTFGEMHGFQAAGLVTYAAGETHGLQAAGMVNLADRVRGAQIGLVNLSRDAVGMQLGLVNLANRSDGATIGLINLIEDGIHEVSLFSSDIAASNVALALGGTHTYTMFTAGVAPYAHSRGWVAGIGLGGRFTAGDFYVDLAGIGRMVRTDFTDEIDEDSTGALFTAQLVAGSRFLAPLEVFAGPTFNVYYTKRERADDAFIPARAEEVGGEPLYLWPGFVAGLSL